MIEHLSDFWHSYIVKPFYVYSEMISRMLFWGWHMRKSYDFDAMTIYDLLEIKLKRLELCLSKYSHCSWNCEPENDEDKLMKKLRLARLLAENLAKERGAVVERVYPQYKMGHLDKEEFLKASCADYRIKERRKAILFKLLSENIEKWWD